MLGSAVSGNTLARGNSVQARADCATTVALAPTTVLSGVGQRASALLLQEMHQMANHWETRSDEDQWNHRAIIDKEAGRDITHIRQHKCLAGETVANTNTTNLERIDIFN